MKRSLNKYFEKSFRKNWDRPALSDYKGETNKYSDVARKIAKLHILFETCNIRKGDKIAICSRNQANWAVSYLAVITYGAVVVPLLHEFKPSNIHHLVNHSDSRFLFVGDTLLENLSIADMPELEAVFSLNKFNIVYAREELYNSAFDDLDRLFNEKFPDFGPDDIKYYEDQPDELALISYTSGSTGFSKGVMIPYRALEYNIQFAATVESQMDNKSNVVSMLPTAHMYGMIFEFLFEMTIGAHVHFLTRLPSPNVILKAMAEVKPDIIITVPMILEKIYKSKLLPFISKSRMKLFLSLPGIDQMVLNRIKKSLVESFGGNFKEVIVGGAALNREVEAFLRRINFPYTVGYGMTECAPIIAFESWDRTKLYSCGKPTQNIKVKINSKDPRNLPGEILVQGDNVFLGYYKNPQATAQALQNGWLRTGDMGIIDSDGFLFIRGRSKTMILGASGQNIYPEEIESSINNLPYVAESLVIDDHGALTALIYPDFDALEADNIDHATLQHLFEEEIEITNLEMPGYCRIAKVEIFPEEFEKTPKKSIKRYLYQR
ncbi:MAG: AMP-binding protein [Bacteroidales bacterium]|nr:AMP-binding protein [Bacteroidales bacterium]